MIEVTIRLDESVLQFIDQQAQGDRSTYINALLLEQRRQALATETIAALQQDIEDLEYQADILAWDSLAGDGIDAEE